MSLINRPRGAHLVRAGQRSVSMPVRISWHRGTATSSLTSRALLDIRLKTLADELAIADHVVGKNERARSTARSSFSRACCAAVKGAPDLAVAPALSRLYCPCSQAKVLTRTPRRRRCNPHKLCSGTGAVTDKASTSSHHARCRLPDGATSIVGDNGGAVFTVSESRSPRSDELIMNCKTSAQLTEPLDSCRTKRSQCCCNECGLAWPPNVIACESYCDCVKPSHCESQIASNRFFSVAADAPYACTYQDKPFITETRSVVMDAVILRTTANRHCHRPMPPSPLVGRT